LVRGAITAAMAGCTHVVLVTTATLVVRILDGSNNMLFESQSIATVAASLTSRQNWGPACRRQIRFS
jgi:hypothetical protein